MRLTKLHIENFGKIIQLDLDFTASLNEIMHENGWGKSTLTVFIKSMFYGIPAKTRGDEVRSVRTKYMPWQGGVYGGFIEYELNGTIYRVTRTFGKSPEYDTFELLDYSNNSVTKDEIKSLGEQLFGIGEDSFTMTAFFPQLNFKSASNSELTANLTGVNKYQDDLANIDKAIKKLKEKRLDIKRQLPKKVEIEDKRMQLNQIKTMSNMLSKEIEEYEEQLLKAKESKFQIDKTLALEKDKLSLQEEKYKSKVNIENEIKDLTAQVTSLYEKQTSIQNKALDNLNNKPKNNFNLIFALLIALFCVIGVTITIVYLLNVVQMSIFIPVIVLSIIAIVVMAGLKIHKDKKEKNLDSKIENSVNLATNFKSQIDELNESVKKLENILSEKYKNVEMPSRDDYESIKNKQSSANLNIYTIENKLLNLRNDLENSISQIDYLASQIEQMKDNLSSLSAKYSLIEKTIDYLLQAKDNVASRYVSTINGEFSSILGKFGIDVNRFVIDNQWTVKEQTNVGTKDFEYSSQGLQDIISFCQRISLINKIYKKEKPFVILDDTFVNLDDNMLTCAKQVVKELAGEFQVIYLCCHSRCSMLN